MTVEFKFDLKQVVVLENGMNATCVGLHVSEEGHQSFLCRYFSSTGEKQEAWFRDYELTAL